MSRQYFSFSDGIRKLKSKSLFLSVIALFIGLTETLPNKLVLIGLDLSNSQEILGWFIFFIALIFLLNYIALAILELIGHFLPSLIIMEMGKATGDTLGLTAEECLQPQEDQDFYDNNSIGTSIQELKDINRKNTELFYCYKSTYIKVHDFYVIVFGLAIPMVFSIVGIYYLYVYLSFLK